MINGMKIGWITDNFLPSYNPGFVMFNWTAVIPRDIFLLKSKS